MALDPTDHPHPALRRPFTSLDGPWAFTPDPYAGWARPGDVAFDGSIVVPFAPETPASRCGHDGALHRAWYRRRLSIDPAPAGRRHVVGFGAVDRSATVFVDDAVVGTHVGGYAPFFVDVTDAVAAGDGSVDLVVRADDDPADIDVPRGKQDWAEDPHAVWYPRTTGIWRSVWVETRGVTHVGAIDVRADPATMSLDLRVRIAGPMPPAGVTAVVRVTSAETGRALVDDRYRVTDPELSRTVRVGDGGFDDLHALVWWPIHPHLLTVTVALLDDAGDELDAAETTTALRSVGVRDGMVCLNGRPYPLRLVLDQGYWPETGATPGSTDDLRRDLELARALGFNGVRKHQKTEDPRFFAWADRLGMLSWVEMPSAYRPGPASARHLLDEWAAIVDAHRGFPSVVGWVPVNESWGVSGAAADPSQRATIEALHHMTDAIDGTRPVSANDGWETVGGDIVGIHDYDQDPDRLRARYGSAEALDRFITSPRADGRLADLDRAPLAGRAPVLSEFGGIALAADTHGGDTGSDGWGYARATDSDDLVRRYRALWAAFHDSDVLAGACWTQLTDTYQEVNGLLTADRTPKADPATLAAATRGRT